MSQMMYLHADRPFATTYKSVLQVWVDRPAARFSAWYEFFPRSASPVPGKHGTFRDAADRMVPYAASMNFDVIYLPPIHPIGREFRKGKNNNPQSVAGEPGSPWAIGSAEGGHTAIHPQLGTLEDFHYLLSQGKAHGLEFALDIAFQCAPDHPYVKEHPNWFRQRPDGTIQYAENPPKKYQDIYPFDFENDDWEALWEELKNVVVYWVEQGVRIFRVDNPHTKPFPFWEWLIAEVRRDYPDTIFLSEAFTRPKVMHRLAKLGFSMSYNYWPWRNTKADITAYLTELTRTEVREFMGPSLWANTQDILTETLQIGGRPAFMSRFVLTATLGTSYGILGPAFEHCINTPLAPGREEYIDSEKYEIHTWDLDAPHSLKGLIARVNQIRRDNPAMHTNANLRFVNIPNDQIIAYVKTDADNAHPILVVVNIDPAYTQSGWLELPLEELGIGADQPYEVHDLLTDARYVWNGRYNYVELNPQTLPAHIFQIHSAQRTERDYEQYM
jgi:starch synthase (maltosyl-transferring)